MKQSLKHLEKKEVEFFAKQRIEKIDELIRLIETLKDEEKMETWRGSRNILKDGVDKIFNSYEFYLSYAATKKQINDIK